MNHYELLYIVPLKMEEDTVEPVVNKITARLKELSGEITLNDNLGKRKLAYPIKQVRYGYYVLVEFNLPTDALKTLARELQLDAEVLRFQIVKKKVKSAATIARQQALQEKLKTQRAREELSAAELKTKPKVTAEPTTSTKLDDLDKKLNEILEQEMVK